MRRAWLCLALAAVLAGCTAEPLAPAPTVTPGADPGITLAYREAYRGAELDVAAQDKLRSAVVRSDAELTAYLLATWGSAGERLRAPYQLDFAQEAGVFLAAGSQPDNGTQLRLTRLTEANGRIEVRFSAYGSPGRFQLQHPYLYLAIPRSALPVEIQQDQPCRQPPDQPLQPCR